MNDECISFSNTIRNIYLFNGLFKSAGIYITYKNKNVLTHQFEN